MQFDYVQTREFEGGMVKGNIITVYHLCSRVAL